MVHKRKLIRDKVKALLTNRIIYDGQAVPVYQTRALPYWDVQLPAIAFYLFQEDVDHKESAPREYWRDFQLAIQIVVKEKQGTITDDIIDAIAIQIENIFFLDPTIGDKIDDSALINTSAAIKDDGDKVYSAAAMIWNLEYRTDAPEAQGAPAVMDYVKDGIQIGVDGSPTPDETIDATIDRTGDMFSLDFSKFDNSMYIGAL